jgi:carboxyl-terminal processing protease
MEGQTLTKIVQRIRGDEGSEITFTVRQPDSDEKRDVKITRGVVPFELVRGYRPGKKEIWDFRINAEDPIGYVHISSITSSIVHELRATDKQLRADGVKAVVLDLRYSSGFRMQHAALAADALLDGGLLWRVRDAAGRVKEYQADRDCLFRDMPLVVLTDPTTAGESVPLLVAALQDTGRAVVVGEVSGFGGFVHGFVEVPGGHGTLSLLTGMVERAKPPKPGTAEEVYPTAAWRVQPDHVVAMSKKESDNLIEWLHDKNLTEPQLGDKPPADAQLAKAVELLRATLKKAAPVAKPN